MINWGIIGLGRIAHTFAKDLAILDNARLHAVASRSLDNARAFADEYRVQHYFGRYEDLLNLPDLDAVYIATPHASHAELSILCLENGIPVLCEKPLAINLHEAQAMVAWSQRTQTFLMEAMWTRFLPHMQKILDLIDANQLGRVHTVKATLGFDGQQRPNQRLFDPELGGGALLDIGVYPVFLAHLLLGRPDAIEAESRINANGIDEATRATFLYENGRKAEIYSSITEATQNEAVIYGERGHIHIGGKWNAPSAFTLYLEGQAPQEFTFNLPGHGFYLEIIEATECIRQERIENPLLTHGFSLDIMETMDRIRMQTGLRYPKDVLLQ
ncbi:MAG: Gfo/Idh/MocA family protein [Saprospiraceae bacterium]